jgi:hypothetical protein
MGVLAGLQNSNILHGKTLYPGTHCLGNTAVAAVFRGLFNAADAVPTWRGF